MLLRAGSKADRAVRSWSDFYAPEDAFCSRVPLPNGAGGKFRAQRVALGYSAFQSAMGRAHNAYFERPEVLEAIIRETGHQRPKQLAGRGRRIGFIELRHVLRQ